MRAVAPQRTADLCQSLCEGQGLRPVREGLPGGAQEQQTGAGSGAAVAAPPFQLRQLLGADSIRQVPTKGAVHA